MYNYIPLSGLLLHTLLSLLLDILNHFPKSLFSAVLQLTSCKSNGAATMYVEPASSRRETVYVPKDRRSARDWDRKVGPRGMGRIVGQQIVVWKCCTKTRWSSFDLLC